MHLPMKFKKSLIDIIVPKDSWSEVGQIEQLRLAKLENRMHEIKDQAGGKYYQFVSVSPAFPNELCLGW